MVHDRGLLLHLIEGFHLVEGAAETKGFASASRGPRGSCARRLVLCEGTLVSVRVRPSSGRRCGP